MEGCGAHQRGERRSERPRARARPRWRRPQRRCLRTSAAGCMPGRVRAPQWRRARCNASAAGCSSAGARRRQGRRGGAAGAQGGWGRATPSALGRHRASRRGSRAPAWPTCVAARGAGTWAWLGVAGSGSGDSASGKDQGEGAESSVGLQRCSALCGAPPRVVPLESAVRPRQPTDGSDCGRPLATRHGEPHAAAPRRLLAVRRVHLVSLQLRASALARR